MKLTQIEYDRVMDAFRQESAKYHRSVDAYWAKQITTSEFILAQSEFKAAGIIVDYAEANLINESC